MPNGRVYGKGRLDSANAKLGVGKGRVKDPVGGLDGEEWGEEEIRRVFIL